MVLTLLWLLLFIDYFSYHAQWKTSIVTIMYTRREHLVEVMLVTCMFSIFILDVGNGDDEQQDIKEPLRKKRKLIVKEVSGE